MGTSGDLCISRYGARIKCSQWKSLSRCMSVCSLSFVYNSFLIKGKKHLKVALFQRRGSKPPDFQFGLYPVLREHSFRHLCPPVSSGDEIRSLQKGHKESTFLSVPGGCGSPQTGTLFGDICHLWGCHVQ